MFRGAVNERNVQALRDSSILRPTLSFLARSFTSYDPLNAAKILSSFLLNGISFVVRSLVSDVYFRTDPYMRGECFLLCSCCRTPTGRGGPRAQARARAPREGRAPRYQKHTSCVLLRTHSAPRSRIARAPELAYSKLKLNALPACNYKETPAKSTMQRYWWVL